MNFKNYLLFCLFSIYGNDLNNQHPVRSRVLHKQDPRFLTVPSNRFIRKQTFKPVVEKSVEQQRDVLHGKIDLLQEWLSRNSEHPNFNLKQNELSTLLADFAKLKE